MPKVRRRGVREIPGTRLRETRLPQAQVPVLFRPTEMEVWKRLPALLLARPVVEEMQMWPSALSGPK
jgi:hypothetical protein